jgi:hypothetical protein
VAQIHYKMTSEKLKQATELQSKISELESIVASAKSQQCTRIEFTFGNGSNSENVCNDTKIIEKIREILIHENEALLSVLKSRFAEL